MQIPLHAGVSGPKNIRAIETFKPMTLAYTKAAIRVENVTARLARIPGALRNGSAPRSHAMWRWFSSRTVVTGIAAVLFIVCCVLPVVYLLTAPLSTGDVSYRAL